MKLLLVLCATALLSCASTQPADRHLFFLHNNYLELTPLGWNHPTYGRVEYREIVDAFQQAGFKVHSEIRPENTDMRAYARKVVQQIDSLLQLGVRPQDITIVGTSKGGYIAMFASSYLKNKELNVVLIGCMDSVELSRISDLDLHGNILAIYEASDTFTTPSADAMQKFTRNVPRFKELKLETGLQHGFLYKALADWIEPAVAWADQRPIEQPRLSHVLDSILVTKHSTPFNGNVLVAQNGRTLYAKCQGYSDIGKRTPLTLTDQFILGSVSKHITATLILREYERGRLALHTPIGQYLPTLKTAWKDSVTIHHLLTHTHGITNLDKPLDFQPGTQFVYGNLGFNLAGMILESVTGKSLAVLSKELFDSIGLTHLTHPDHDADSNVVIGYASHDGKATPVANTMQASVAAGGFISSTLDLAAWTSALHSGKLLHDSTYKLMTTKKPNAIRPHPAFDQMDYGYGLCIDKDIIGHTGFAPGFVSVAFYYPKTQIAVIVLENVADENISRAYDYHKHIVDALRTYGE